MVAHSARIHRCLSQTTRGPRLTSTCPTPKKVRANGRILASCCSYWYRGCLNPSCYKFRKILYDWWCKTGKKECQFICICRVNNSCICICGVNNSWATKKYEIKESRAQWHNAQAWLQGHGKSGHLSDQLCQKAPWEVLYLYLSKHRIKKCSLHNGKGMEMVSNCAFWQCRLYNVHLGMSVLATNPF